MIEKIKEFFVQSGMVIAVLVLGIGFILFIGKFSKPDTEHGTKTVKYNYKYVLHTSDGFSTYAEPILDYWVDSHNLLHYTYTINYIDSITVDSAVIGGTYRITNR
jgi:hypothetical protein